MGFEKLNSVASNYYALRDELSFRKLYDEAAMVFKNENRQLIKRSGLGNENDADEIFDSVILKLSRKRPASSFGGSMSASLKNARIDFIRSETSRRKRFVLTLDEENEDAPTSEISDEITVEDEVFRRQKKKKADQRQLIDFLVDDPSQVDHDTTLIVSQFPQYDSITALAKALGMHHEYVKRKLRRLSRRYDANRFGDYSDYLAV